MELTDFSREPYRPRGESRRMSRLDSVTGCCGYQMIKLRKYSLPICLAEALLILVVVTYLVLIGYDSSERNIQQPLQDRGLITLPEWARQEAQLNKWMSGPLVGCDQRAHDLRFGVSCRSNGTCKSLGSAAAGSNPSKNNRVLVVRTSKAGDRLKATEIEAENIKCSGSAECPLFRTKLRIYRDQPRQEIVGWGGALTDSSINNLLSLTTNATRSLLDDYFSDDGLRYNMIRITIGGSDFSSRFYTNDDVRAGATDFSLNNFTLTEEDLLYKVPVLRFILENYDKPGRALRLFASMWSPPLWMKDNNHFNKGRLIGSSLGPIFAGGGHEVSAGRVKRNSGGPYYDALANLKLKFLHAYHKLGVDFWAITVMNEPIFAVQPFLDFNTMIFAIDDYTVYVSEFLGPKLKSDPLLKSVKLLAHDDNRRYLMNYTNALLKEERARKYIDGISTHGYIDQDYHYMQQLYDLYDGSKGPSMFLILPSELSSGHLPFMEKALVGNWHRGIHYGLDIIRGLQNAAAGWVDWNMALDTQGGPGWLGGRLDSPIIVDKAHDLYYKSPMYYVIGQFSRYIPPGSRRLDMDVSDNLYDNQFETVAFIRPDKRIVVVCLNNNPYPIYLDLSFGSTGQPPESSASSLRLSCSQDSVVTFIFDDKSFAKR